MELIDGAVLDESNVPRSFNFIAHPAPFDTVSKGGLKGGPPHDPSRPGNPQKDLPPWEDGGTPWQTERASFLGVDGLN